MSLPNKKAVLAGRLWFSTRNLFGRGLLLGLHLGDDAFVVGLTAFFLDGFVVLFAHNFPAI